MEARTSLQRFPGIRGCSEGVGGSAMEGVRGKSCPRLG